MRVVKTAMLLAVMWMLGCKRAVQRVVHRPDHRGAPQAQEDRQRPRRAQGRPGPNECSVGAVRCGQGLGPRQEGDSDGGGRRGRGLGGQQRGPVGSKGLC